MAKIFISYNRSSLAAVENWAEDLRDLWDHQVWYDQVLTGGQRWWDDILAHIRDSDIFLFALTAASLDSQACRQELLYADRLARPILPIKLSDDVSENMLYRPLSEIQVMDCRLHNRTTQAALRRAVQALAIAPALPDPLPPPPPVPLSYLGNLRERIDSSDTLEYPEQAGLILDLKNYLKGRGLNAQQEVAQLLQRLRQRPDLMAIVAGEIDEIMNQLQLNNASATAAQDADKPAQQNLHTPPPQPQPQHRRERLPSNKAPIVAPNVAQEPAKVFAVHQAEAAVEGIVSYLLKHKQNWKIALDEQNFILLSRVKEPGKPLGLTAGIQVRDNLKDEKQNALKAVGWEIGSAQVAKGLGTAAVLYITSGLGALGLLSKTVRDYIMACTARKTWHAVQRPALQHQIALELASALKKIADPDAIVHAEQVTD